MLCCLLQVVVFHSICEGNNIPVVHCEIIMLVVSNMIRARKKQMGDSFLMENCLVPFYLVL